MDIIVDVGVKTKLLGNSTQFHGVPRGSPRFSRWPVRLAIAVAWPVTSVYYNCYYATKPNYTMIFNSIITLSTITVYYNMARSKPKQHRVGTAAKKKVVISKTLPSRKAPCKTPASTPTTQHRRWWKPSSK